MAAESRQTQKGAKRRAFTGNLSVRSPDLRSRPWGNCPRLGSVGPVYEVKAVGR